MVGEKIREIRESHGWTQQELADRIGITRSAVNSWEMGLSTPSLVTLVEFAKRTNSSTDYILDLSDRTNIMVENLSEEHLKLILNMIDALQSNH